MYGYKVEVSAMSLGLATGCKVQYFEAIADMNTLCHNSVFHNATSTTYVQELDSRNKELVERHRDDFGPFLLTRTIGVLEICFGSYTLVQHPSVVILQLIKWCLLEKYHQTVLSLKSTSDV